MPLSSVLRSPLRSALRTARGEGVGGPLSQFLSGAGSADYDAKKALTHWFTDSAGTIPVTASGDKIGRWTDATGHGFNGTQGTANARLNALLTGTRWTATGDGVDDNLLTSLLASAGDMSVFIDVDVPATISANQVVLGANEAGPTNRLQIGFNTSGHFVAGVGGDSVLVVKDAVDWRSQRFVGALVIDNTNSRVKLFTSNGTPYDAAKNGSPTGTIAARLAGVNNNGSAGSYFTGGIGRVSYAPKALLLADFNLMRAEQLAYNS